MIDAWGAACLRPSIIEKIKRQEELLKTVEAVIISAAKKDENQVQFEFDAIDKDYLFDTLKKNYYEYVIVFESKSPDPHHNILIKIYW